MAELGYQVELPGWAHFATDPAEKNPDLQHPHSIDVFDQMRSEDSQVGSVLRAVTLPIRAGKWQLDCEGVDPRVAALVSEDLGLPIKGQEFKQPARARDRFSWDEHLRLALLSLVYGHSFFEQVYRFDEAAALYRLRKLAWRPPRSISKIEVARDGGLVGIRQYGVDPLLGVNRLVAYVNEREGGNWVGRSVLRTAYKNWLLKDRILRTQALTVDRNGLGVPVYTGAPLPEGKARMAAADVERWRESEKDSGLALARGFRAGETAGASIPAGSKLELIGVTGKLPDTDKPIRYHDEQIARAVLAHFLNLGTETGSWALGSTFADFFTGSLNAVARSISTVSQQHVVEDLVDLNFGADVPAPRLECEPIGAEMPVTAEAIRALIESGAIRPDDELEAHVRARWGLPAFDAASGRGESVEANGVASDAEQALFAATAAQKVYLATDKVVLNQDEARDLVRRAGGQLIGDAPDTQRVPDAEIDVPAVDDLQSAEARIAAAKGEVVSV